MRTNLVFLALLVLFAHATILAAGLSKSGAKKTNKAVTEESSADRLKEASQAKGKKSTGNKHRYA